jgi:hypothetical protein
MAKEFKQIGKGFWVLWAVASTIGIFFSMYVNFNVSVFSPFSQGMDRLLEGILQGVIFGVFAGLPLWLLLRLYSSMASWWLVISAVGGAISSYLIAFADDTARGHAYWLIYLLLIAIATGFVGGGITGRIMGWALQPAAAEWN